VLSSSLFNRTTAFSELLFIFVYEAEILQSAILQLQNIDIQCMMSDDECDQVADCELEYARAAHELVDIAINRALDLLAEKDWCNVSLDEYIVPADVKRRTPVKEVSSDKLVEPQPNVSWPTIEEFTSDLGTERILEFIKVGLVARQNYQHLQKKYATL